MPRVDSLVAATRTRGHRRPRGRSRRHCTAASTRSANEKCRCRSSFYASRHSSSGGSSAPASRTVTCHRPSVARCCAPSCGLEAECEVEGGGVESTCSRAELCRLEAAKARVLIHAKHACLDSSSAICAARLPASYHPAPMSRYHVPRCMIHAVSLGFSRPPDLVSALCPQDHGPKCDCEMLANDCGTGTSSRASLHRRRGVDPMEHVRRTPVVVT